MRVWILLLSIVPTALLAGPAAAQGGANLAWDDCYLGSPQMMKTFTCDTDAGPPFTLVGSFVPGPDAGAINGMIAILDLCTMPYALPDWWRVGSGDCRQGAITASFDFTSGPFSCSDPWQGQATGGMNAQVATLGSTRLRLTLLVVLPEPITLAESDEYYAFRVAISKAGTSACGGCPTNACLVLNEVRLTRPPSEQGDVFLYNPATNYYVTWQGLNQSPPCPFVVSTRPTTWGQLKSLYH